MSANPIAALADAIGHFHPQGREAAEAKACDYVSFLGMLGYEIVMLSDDVFLAPPVEEKA